MTNRKSMEGYRPPYIAGIQKGEGLLPTGAFLSPKAAQVAEEVKAIPRRWPEDRSYKPIIPTKAFYPSPLEPISSVQARFGIVRS